MATIAIASFGCIDQRGVLGPAGVRTWEQLGVSGLDQLRWRQISGVPSDRFGRMDILSKAAMVAAEMLGLPVLPDEIGQLTGVVLGTRFGSVDIDTAFLRSTHRSTPPSPLQFASGLPSIAAAEVAIRHLLRGEHLCLSAGHQTTAAVLHEAMQLILTGEIAQCVCLVGDAVGDDARDVLSRADGEQPETPCAVYAFLLMPVDAADGPPLATCTIGPKDTGDLLPSGASAEWLSRWLCDRQAPPRLVLDGPEGLQPGRVLIFERHTPKESSN